MFLHIALLSSVESLSVQIRQEQVRAASVPWNGMN
jgi:hypothetical protein